MSTTIFNSVPGVGLDASKGMNGDCWLSGVRCRLVGVFIDHLDGEELLADCLVAVSEEFITTKTFTVFPALGDFGRSESDGAQCQERKTRDIIKCINNATERLLTKDEDIKNKWREYFDKLFNEDSGSPSIELDISSDDLNRQFVREIQESEVKDALKR
jgi:hypothetical protein